MRITPKTLIKIAQDTVARRTRGNRDILAAYLHGAVLEEAPLLGGTADIDLVFIHDDEVIFPREIQRLTDEVHLDIAHHARKDYQKTRSLRLHPWLGPTIVGCMVLYDPQHFMDFTQASVGGQFYRPDYILGRARSQADHARQIWLGLDALNSEAGIEEVGLYLRAVEHAANAIASLSGPPLTERRLLLRFPERAESIGRPGLYPGLTGLLGSANVDAQTMDDWLLQWEAAYKAIPEKTAPARLHPDRFAYYRRAMATILDGERPHDVLWPMLHTWTQTANLFSPDSPERQGWSEAFQHAGLLGADFSQRITALDAYLDTVEEALEAWAMEHGA